MRALDTILTHYGDDATLEDAVLIFEVTREDPEHDGETMTEMNAESTTHRASVAGGLAAAYAMTQLVGYERAD